MPFKVINWPEQHYQNGTAKNNDTNKRYKSLVRVFKSLCNEMNDNDINYGKMNISMKFYNTNIIWRYV